MSQRMIAPGWYGKLPTHGDFVRARLSGRFLDAWDAWLSAGMGRGAEALRDRWLAAYDGAPIWRFTLAPGKVGPAPVTGLLSPSVDSVGRRFPFTVAVPGWASDGRDGLGAAWLDEAEAAVLAALAGEGDALKRLAAIEIPDPGEEAAGSALSVWRTIGGPSAPPRSLETDDWPAPALFARLMAGEAEVL